MACGAGYAVEAAELVAGEGRYADEDYGDGCGFHSDSEAGEDVGGGSGFGGGGYFFDAAVVAGGVVFCGCSYE